MLKIRLSRVGRKHEPVYRLILVESTEPAKTGKAIEVLGNYDSRNAEKAEFKDDRILYWISKGAQISDTVHNLLLKKSIIKGKKRGIVPPKVFKAERAKIAEKEAAAFETKGEEVKQISTEDPAPVDEIVEEITKVASSEVVTDTDAKEEVAV